MEKMEKIACLEHIYLCNFKSYCGIVHFGPIKNLSVIVGRNGAGKSNILDALSFVLGVDSRRLRIKHFSDLIHGANIGKPVADSTYVTAVFHLKTGEEKTFKRIIKCPGTVYKIDNEEVTAKYYLSELKHLGIMTNAKNCLVSQGTIENLATMTRKEMSIFFEEISGSMAHKQQYDSLRDEMQIIENEQRCLMTLRKSLSLEVKQLTKIKKAATQYELIHEQHKELMEEMYLFELYHIREDMKTLKDTKEKEYVKINNLEEKKNEISQRMKLQKEEAKILLQELEDIEKTLSDKENAFSERKLEYDAVKEQIKYWQAKLDKPHSLLNKARQIHVAHLETIKEVQSNLKEAEQMIKELERTNEMSSQENNFDRSDSQVQEYFRLKAVLEKEMSTLYMANYNRIKEDQVTDQYTLDNENRREIELQQTLRQQGIQKEETEQNIKKLAQNIENQENELARLIESSTAANNKIVRSKKQREVVEAELQAVSAKLAEVSDDMHISASSKKKAEIIRILKERFPEVHGRVSELCRPSHSRYNVAITAIFRKMRDAIIVDTSKCVVQCIKYLKEKQLSVEIFLPLNDLKVNPLKESLRDIKTVKHVSLAYDVVEFSDKRINNAILFLTNNILICNTSEDAQKVAYEMDERHDCVALDGTFYHKNGHFTGGFVDSFKKAKAWDEQHVSELEASRTTLLIKLKEIREISRSESDLNTMDLEIRGLQMRLKHTKYSYDEYVAKLGKIESAIKDYTERLDNVHSSIASIKRRMEMRDRDIQNIETSIAEIQNKLFENFCNKLGIDNIQQFEQRSLIHYQEQAKRKEDLNEHYERITNLLDFEIHRDTTSAIENYENIIKVTNEHLEEAFQKETLCKIKIEEAERLLHEQRSKYKETNQNLARLTTSIKKNRQTIDFLCKQIQETNRKHTAIIINITKLKNEVVSIIRMNKLGQTDLRLNTIPDSIYESDRTSSDSNDLCELDILSEIDFSPLPEKLKNGEVAVNRSRLEKQLVAMKNKLQAIGNPDPKASQKLEKTVDDLKSTKKKFEEQQRKYNTIYQKFEKEKDQRLEKFNTCYEIVSVQLDSIYKLLYKDNNATAVLLAEDPVEPYLGGLNFSCIPSGKRLQPLDSLSGGERTLASLAMLFAVNEPAPFFAIDEMDAALDSINRKYVTDFVRTKKCDTKILMITLNRELMLAADGLYGVTSREYGDLYESLLYTVDPSALSVKKNRNNTKRR